MSQRRNNKRLKGESKPKPLTIILNRSIIDLAGFLYLLLLNDILNVRSWKTVIRSEWLK